MLGYAYGDAENAIDAVRVNDAALAVEWLEARNVAKIQMLAPTELPRPPHRRGRDDDPSDSRRRGNDDDDAPRHPPGAFDPRAGSFDPRAGSFDPRAGSFDPRAGPLPPSFDRGCRPRDGRGRARARVVARRANENRPRRERVIRGA